MSKVREATNNVVIPTVVALAIIGLAGKALGFINFGERDDNLRTRLIAVEVRQVESERQWRQDRNELMLLLMEMKSSISRIEGKLEK